MRSRKETRSALTLVELLVVVVIIGLLAGLLLPAVWSAREASKDMSCYSNLKQIGIALHYYVDDYGQFPPPYTVDADGQRLHSWRTLILPYMERGPLYDSIDLSKPWDDPANQTARETVVESYCCPETGAPSTNTPYLVIVSDEGVFRPGQSTSVEDIADGLSSTLLVIEVDQPNHVHWMSPYDVNEQWLLDFAQHIEMQHQGGTNAVFADAAGTFLSDSATAESLRAMITIAGGEAERNNAP